MSSRFTRSGFLLLKLIGLILVLCQAQSGWSLCVNASSANLRSQPSAKSTLTWRVGRHTPLIQLDVKGSWVKVKDQDGDTHWVAGNVVTSSYSCLSVKSDFVTVREGPTATSPPHELVQVERYAAFKKLDLQGDYYQVESPYKEKYWVHRNYVWRPLKVIGISY